VRGDEYPGQRFETESVRAYRERVGKKVVPGGLHAYESFDGVFNYPHGSVGLTWNGDVGSFITWKMTPDQARELAQRLLDAADKTAPPSPTS